jgi:hypothetical protein
MLEAWIERHILTTLAEWNMVGLIILGVVAVLLVLHALHTESAE